MSKLPNDCFALPPGVHWTPVDEAQSLLRARLSCVTGEQAVPLFEAGGRILARDLTALRSNPPCANAAVDGYGFAHAALAQNLTLPLAQGRSAAGHPLLGELRAGQAVKILTGAALPLGVDTVVLQEETRLDGDTVRLAGLPRLGANTRQAGEDANAGDTLFAAGHSLRPQDLALLAATGHGRVPVRERLRVGVMSTGDELAEPGAQAALHQTYDANRPMLLALLAAWGHDAVDLGRAPDDRQAVGESLDAAAGQVDALLTSGGASAGDEDHISAVLGASGNLVSWRIAIKPGRPLALAIWKGMPVFGLPGNPVASFTCALLFARPSLSLLAGAGWTEPDAITVPAGFAKKKKAGRREFLRARLRDGQAEVFRSEGSGRISGLAWSDGFVELPDEAGVISPGDPVRYLPYRAFGL